MKKIIITLFLALTATNINAQLVVDSLGRVGIATDSVKSMLAVGTCGNSDSAIRFRTSEGKYGIHLANYTNDTICTYGGYFRVSNNQGDCYGIKTIATGGNDLMDTARYAIGICAKASEAHMSIGLWGGKMGGAFSWSPNLAGVYGSETGSFPSFQNGTYDYSGTYAGYFNGKVRVTNGIYATVLSPTASYSPSEQNGTTILSDRSESVTDKLSQVQTLQFLRYNPDEETISTRINIEDVDIDNLSLEEQDSLSEVMGDEPEHYLSAIQYGLDADQLKAVFPELVYEDANGNVSINYVEMVPLLVQCINELKDEIAELKGTSPRKAKAQPTAIEETVSDIDMVRMDQNKPNPFSESTVIALNIPSNAQTANIYIYDMIGKQVQSLPVSERGETNITVYAADLSAGMYIYTLVVDGKVSVTRRMIVTM